MWSMVDLPHTQYTRKNLTCDREKAYSPTVGSYRRVSLFQDGTQSTKVPIAGHAFFQPYSADKLVHAPYQLIASGLKQLNREDIGPLSLVVFESLYRNTDLVVIDWCRFRPISKLSCNPKVAEKSVYNLIYLTAKSPGRARSCWPLLLT